jgi:hypothetical protein
MSNSQINEDLVGIAAGVGFAAAYAWMDVFSKVLFSIIPMDKQSFAYFLSYALMTTLFSFLIFYLIRGEKRRRRSE